MGKRNAGQRRSKSSSQSESEQFQSKRLKEKSDISSGEEVKLVSPKFLKTDIKMRILRLIKANNYNIMEFNLGSLSGEPKQLKDNYFEYKFDSFDLTTKKNKSIMKFEKGVFFKLDEKKY